MMYIHPPRHGHMHSSSSFADVGYSRQEGTAAAGLTPPQRNKKGLV